MRVLVCGDRDWDSIVSVLTVLHRFGTGDTLVHGACRGADTIAAEVGTSLGMDIEPHPADWKQHGRAAGPIRNQEMLDSGVDLVIAFHPDINKSKGTRDMVTRATKAGITVEIINA